LALAALTSADAGLRAADWPTYRADAARTGYSSDPLPDYLELRWVHRTRTGAAPAWPNSSRITFDLASQPVLVGPLVIFGTSAEDKIVALDADSGTVRWTFFTGGPVRFAPAAWRDRIFVASDDGYLYAIRWADGALLWKHRGGPNERMCLGNERLISRWPARGGPVVMEGTVYYAAGIWPSDGVFLHALEARTGKVLWTNDRIGRLSMPQPHPGANANSGVSPQGYLVATESRLFVPTGRAVPAAFRRADGELEYYRLQQNGSIGGSRAMAADRFIINGGCFLEQDTGNLGARAGRGVFSVLPDGILQSTGNKLLAYRWADLETHDPNGNPVPYRGLERRVEILLEAESKPGGGADTVLKKLPSLRALYRTEVRFAEADKGVPKQTGLERALAQARPDVEALGYEIDPFLATTYERQYEVIGAGGDAVCGGPGVVRVASLADGRVRWSHEVQGEALGLAAANGRLIVSTSKGVIYCFGAARAVETGGVQPSPRPSGLEAATRSPEESSAVVRAVRTDYARIAREILDKSGVRTGICVDLGCGTGELALELVRQSQLYVVALDADPAKVRQARRMLDEAGVYGDRVAVHQGDPGQTPYPDNFANLIVSSQALAEPSAALNEVEMARLQRPYGGTVCVGAPGRWQVHRRGPPEGAGQWTHQNCDAANTLCSTDEIVRGPLEMAWYRDDVLEITDRHAQGPAPLFSQGYLVVEGVDGICAVDAYNGRTVWTYPIRGILADWDGVHHDVGIGDAGSNFCLSDDAVFVRTGGTCLKLDLATGRRIREFKTPVEPAARNRNWGYVACLDGLLFGSVLNDEHTVSPRYANIRLRNESVLFFAMDAQTGELKWQYRPEHSLRNNAIALAAGRVYLIDRPLALADRITDPKRDGKHRPVLQPDEHPGGTLIAFEASSGSVLWKNEEDIFGTQIGVSSEHGVLLMHYQAVKHNFFRLPSEIGGRMAAFDLKTSVRLWDIKADCKTRPILNDDTIYAEGGAWKLKTGEPVPWDFKRSYGCGQMAGSTHLLVFRSATIGYWDLRQNRETENFGGARPGCWFNGIPAGGLVLVPDGSSQCACSYQMRSWLALQPRR
jgi:outer membrane protein assembly factor BamB